MKIADQSPVISAENKSRKYDFFSLNILEAKQYFITNDDRSISKPLK